MKTIKVTDELHKTLNTLKVHPRESYNDVITRLVDEKKEEQ